MNDSTNAGTGHLPQNHEVPVGYLETRAAIVADPAASYWLREAMAALEKRDPIDALKDAEALALLSQLRANEILGKVK